MTSIILRLIKYCNVEEQKLARYGLDVNSNHHTFFLNSTLMALASFNSTAWLSKSSYRRRKHVVIKWHSKHFRKSSVTCNGSRTYNPHVQWLITKLQEILASEDCSIIQSQQAGSSRPVPQITVMFSNPWRASTSRRNLFVSATHVWLRILLDTCYLRCFHKIKMQNKEEMSWSASWT